MVECLAQRLFPLLHGTIHLLLQSFEVLHLSNILQLLNPLTAKFKVRTLRTFSCVRLACLRTNAFSNKFSNKPRLKGVDGEPCLRPKFDITSGGKTSATCGIPMRSVDTS